MTHEEFKDRLVNVLNETDELPIADIEVNDKVHEIKVVLEDHTQFLITTAPYGRRYMIR